MINITKVRIIRYYAGVRIESEASPGPVPQPEGRSLAENPVSSRDLAPQLLILRSDTFLKLDEEAEFFSTLLDFQTPSPNLFHDLFDGINPISGELMPGKRVNGGRGGAFDLQLSIPKSVSVAAAVLPEREGWFDQICAVQAEAVRKALHWAFQQGLFVTRVGGQFQPVELVCVMICQHITSRADDPQGHIHGVTFQTAARADGKLCQLDMFLLKKYQHALSSVARTYEIAGLRALGFHIVPAEQSYRVAGVPDELVRLFSKRRDAILTVLEADGLSSAGNRIAAQHAAYQTRPDKSAQADLMSLFEAWASEAQSAGYTPDELKKAIFNAQTRADASLAAAEMPQLEDVVDEAIAKLCEHNATFTRPELLRAVFEATQPYAFNPDDVVAVIFDNKTGIESVKAAGQIPTYTHKKIREAEQELIRLVAASRGVSRPADVDLVNFHLADLIEQELGRPKLSPEQAAAVRHVTLHPDGIVLLNGAAGAGKSVAMQVVNSIFTDSGQRVFGTALSWRATKELQTSAGLPVRRCFAVAKLLHDLDSGQLSLRPGDVVILDEAGMVGTQAMKDLVRYTASAGAKLIAVGDAEQLKPVAAGDPFQLLQRMLPVARVEKVQRQTGRDEAEGIAMVGATTAFSRGDTRTGLEYYEGTGALKYCEDRARAISAAAAAYLAHCKDYPSESRAMTAQWNEDCAELNSAIRERLIQDGLLASRSVTFKALTRGSKSKVQQLEVRVNDELIFGENLEFLDLFIRNGTRAKVVRISGPDADPWLSLLLDDGNTINARPSELIGFRGAGKARAALPVLQHGYCYTAHAAQGMTVDAHFDVVLRRRGAESTYVCASRHRKSLAMFVDAQRVAKDEQERRYRMPLASPWRSVNPMKPPKERQPITAMDIREAFFAEAGRSETAKNISESIDKDDLLAWSRRGRTDAKPLAPASIRKDKKVSPPSRFKIVNSMTPDQRQAAAIVVRDLLNKLPLSAIERPAVATEQQSLTDAIHDLCARDFSQPRDATDTKPLTTKVTAENIAAQEHEFTPFKWAVKNEITTLGPKNDEPVRHLPADLKIDSPDLPPLRTRRRIAELAEFLRSGFSMAYEQPSCAEMVDFKPVLDRLGAAMSLKGGTDTAAKLADEGLFAPVVVMNDAKLEEAVFFDADAGERAFVEKIGDKLGLEFNAEPKSILMAQIGSPQMAVKDELLDARQKSVLQFPGLLKEKLSRLTDACGSLMPLIEQAPEALAKLGFGRSLAAQLTKLKVKGMSYVSNQSNTAWASATAGGAVNGSPANSDRSDFTADEADRKAVGGTKERQFDRRADADVGERSNEFAGLGHGTEDFPSGDNPTSHPDFSTRYGRVATAAITDADRSEPRVGQPAGDDQSNRTTIVKPSTSNLTWKWIMARQISKKFDLLVKLTDENDILFSRWAEANKTVSLAVIKKDGCYAAEEVPPAIRNILARVFELPLNVVSPRPKKRLTTVNASDQAVTQVVEPLTSSTTPTREKPEYSPVKKAGFAHILFDPAFLATELTLAPTTGYANSIREIASFNLSNAEHIDVAVNDLFAPTLSKKLGEIFDQLGGTVSPNLTITPFIPDLTDLRAPENIIFVFNPPADLEPYWPEDNGITLVIPVRNGCPEGTSGVVLDNVTNIILHENGLNAQAEAPIDVSVQIESFHAHIEGFLIPSGVCPDVPVNKTFGDFNMFIPSAPEDHDDHSLGM